MPPFIKVCGIQSVEEAAGAARAGATALGVLVGVNGDVPDRVTPDAGKRIAASVPAGVTTVMVTHLTDPEEVADIAAYMKVRAVQVHGDMDVRGLRALRSLLPEVLIIKTVHVTGDEAMFRAREFAAAADMLLLDTAAGGKIGGTGVTHDWSVSAGIAGSSRVPVILAGGLGPDNVAAAIERVKPAGVDANSGLEHEDGRKDFEKIKAFVAAARLLTGRT
ncbi:MAG TPA: phosphoribosylanthranilate isomerase [Thermodesulfobacteriota bacterium]|nr:phosphoribosylanthranilate isomerase [Thermodesulfobacteriota bacterium]